MLLTRFYQVSPNDVVSIREKAKKRPRVKALWSWLSSVKSQPAEVDAGKMEGNALQA